MSLAKPDEARLLTATVSLPGDPDGGILESLSDSGPTINTDLWRRLIERGIAARDKHDFTRALSYFAAARQAALKLSDQTLEGLALYQTGLTHTYQWQLEAAIQDYLESRSLLLKVKADEHLVYVLADLGALCYY